MKCMKLPFLAARWASFMLRVPHRMDRRRGSNFRGRCQASTLPAGSKSLCILDTAESHRSRTVVTGRQEQQLAMLIVFVSLWEVPYRALRLIVAASAKDGSASVLIEVLVGPLPDISDHVHYAERTRSLGMRIHIAWGKHRTPLIRSRCWS